MCLNVVFLICQETINFLFYKCVEMLREDHYIRVSNAMLVSECMMPWFSVLARFSVARERTISFSMTFIWPASQLPAFNAGYPCWNWIVAPSGNRKSIVELIILTLEALKSTISTDISSCNFLMQILEMHRYEEVSVPSLSRHNRSIFDRVCDVGDWEIYRIKAKI